ncbi:NACHT domain-containing protein [Micromonospora fluostatini]|uniref:NACHT domain-containing protein n=1 Tax=Micromonospora fluostatini TaxID=1629071 RepID=A0ABY2DI24_9ACTN|nr:NACHT domain-containing protein [Micromonospora fluostatini]
MTSSETGQEFEVRALNVARAIHDPLFLQGAVMIDGVEHDAIFSSDDSINCYEFTTSRTKAKAEHDAEKLRKIIQRLSKVPNNSFKSIVGWFVTREEPTGDQREAVKRESNKASPHATKIHCISLRTLQRRLCDVGSYLRSRDNYPFGSVGFSPARGTTDVDQSFAARDSAFNMQGLAEQLTAGRRILLHGQFGVGKSHALKKLYLRLRAQYSKNPEEQRFPLHINLRDCIGLRSPAEILRRHAEEIGFEGDRSLISAWRAGACVLLLDGFDEVTPTRWLGNVSDLRTVRWQALDPVRRLIQDAREETGIAVCGRAHYFTSLTECRDALGLTPDDLELELTDFDSNQVQRFLSAASSDLPEWLPTRPLLLAYLLNSGALSNLSDQNDTPRAAAWNKLLDEVCAREARALSGVRPDIVRAILGRVATLARSGGDALGPINMGHMEQAFYEVNGRRPDDEGIQLLLRLPGLTSSGDESKRLEERVFADQALSDVAFGDDLAKYISSPYQGHPLTQPASWANASNELTLAVAAHVLIQNGVGLGAVKAALKHRDSQGLNDSILADLIGVANEIGSDIKPPGYIVEGVYFDYLSVGEFPTLSLLHIKDSVIETLDLSGVSSPSESPHFDKCLFGFVDGVSDIPPFLADKFQNCEVQEFSQASHTTSGIAQLPLPRKTIVALTILKKVYAQRGSGRKEGALSRGLSQTDRQLVPDVLARLVSDKWLTKVGRGSTTIYLPVKGKRQAAMQALDTPASLQI